MAADTTKQKLAYTLSIGGYTVKSEDVLELYFVEDIFSLSIAGRLKFIDRLGIIERVEEFTGNEFLVISYGALQEIVKGQTKSEWDRENSLDAKFYIYSIRAQEMNRATNLKIYNILFVDTSYYLFNALNFSYSWPENTTPDKIVEEFAKNLCKLPYNIKTEASKTQFPCYYSPYWNFRQNLQYLSPKCRSAAADVSGYVGFSHIKDLQFNFDFVTLESLLSQTSVSNFNKFDFYALGSEVSQIPDSGKVLDYRILSYDNTNFNHLMGATYYGYDPEKGKEPFKKPFNYKQALEKTTVLGNYSLFAFMNPDAKFDDITSQDTDPTRPVIWTLETDEEIIENIFYDDWVKRYCQQQMIEAVVLGNVHRSIGDMAEIYMPRKFKKIYNESPENVDGVLGEGNTYDIQLKNYNPKYAGKALIKSITHYFQPEPPGYIQKIVLIKNGFESIQAGDFLEAVKKNTSKGMESASSSEPATPTATTTPNEQPNEPSSSTPQTTPGAP